MTVQNYLELESLFNISLRTQLEMIANFHEEMKRGLAGKKSSLKMLPAFIWPPSGEEQGEYLAIDFGGTNFRVMSVKLLGQGKISKPIAHNYKISTSVMRGAREDLGNFIVDSVLDFMQKEKIDPQFRVKIGLTFSFPMKQLDIRSGILINWTKDFAVADVVGTDVVDLVESAFFDNGFHQIKVGAILNDTVGTFCKGRYTHPNCSLGVIAGTGTNASYSEKISNIKKSPQLSTKTDEMLINIEWCGFNLFPRNHYDRAVDKLSQNKGEQFFEKAVSALYLGTLTSLVVNSFVATNKFSHHMKILEKDKFFTAEELSLVLAYSDKNLHWLRMTLVDKGIQTTQADRILIKKIAELVFSRSAKFLATLIVATVTKNDPELKRRHTVAIDGSLYEKAHGYKGMVQMEIDLLTLRKEGEINLFVCKDGSGVGAAIVNAVAFS